MTSASTPRTPRTPRPPSARRRRGALGPTIVILVALVIALFITAQLWTEVLWFSQIGYLQVLRVEWVTRGLLFLGGLVVMAGAVAASLTAAYRSRPIYAPSNQEQVSLDQYREAIEPLRRLVSIAGPALVGIFAGIAASQQWSTIQLWANRVPFGQKDPQFHLDLSFYIFELPGLRFIVSFLMTTAVLAGIAGIATQYLYGGIRIGGEPPRTTKAARVQLAVTGAVLMLLIAGNYWLDRYSLLTRAGDRFDGASYADVSAVIPAKQILTGIAILVAIVFVVTAFRGNWRLPAIGLGVMVVSAIAVGGIYPALVQRFQVAPNEQQFEAPYIQRNIDATKTAYGLDNVEVSPYNATTQATPGALRSDAETTASIRLLDPQIVSPSFSQLQQNKQYYKFADTLSVDRYKIAGQSRDTVIAVRELNLAGLGTNQQNWVNDHTVFTHGYGVVAAYGNTTGADGRPAFYEGDIPSNGGLGKYEPRIYFGQNSPDYSIVGAPSGTAPWELDYPDDKAGGQVDNTFPTATVKAGPSIGSFWNKLLYSLKFGSEQIMFSDRVTPDSQILYDRDPSLRVQKVAPYLTLDGRVYPAVVDGRVKWIVDGYTTSDGYPYSASMSLQAATTDSQTAASASTSVQGLLPAKVNYIRNSVKATVDAYSGEVTLYAWDPQDPVLQAWNKVFPSTLKPISAISGQLMSHMRYPEDLFKVQRTLLADYHVTSATDFFTGQDFWAVPNDPTQTGSAAQEPQPPYYLTLQMPSQSSPAFSLTSTFIPQNTGSVERSILTGFLAADAEAGDVAGVKSPGYGKLRLIELPRNSTVPGPGQVANKFTSDPTASTTLNLLNTGGSTVIRGNLLTLPVGGGLLYVQPVYVQSSTGTKFPLLQKVLVSFGDTVGFSDTLSGALDQVFGGNSGATTTDGTTVTPTPTPAPSGGTSTGTGGTVNATARAALAQALTEANAAIAAGQKALAAGDFAAYGTAQTNLQKAIEAAVAAEANLGATG
ncbi:MAG: UPF0182 family membrane protein [Cellulomonas sp.]